VVICRIATPFRLCIIKEPERRSGSSGHRSSWIFTNFRNLAKITPNVFAKFDNTFAKYSAFRNWPVTACHTIFVWHKNNTMLVSWFDWL
jgi:hypothetical protein